jgi:hypothetical protein
VAGEAKMWSIDEGLVVAGQLPEAELARLL